MPGGLAREQLQVMQFALSRAVWLQNMLAAVWRFHNDPVLKALVMIITGLTNLLLGRQEWFGKVTTYQMLSRRETCPPAFNTRRWQGGYQGDLTIKFKCLPLERFAPPIISFSSPAKLNLRRNKMDESCEPSRSVTLAEKLTVRQKDIEQKLADVKRVREILKSDPELEELLTILNRLGRNLF